MLPRRLLPVLPLLLVAPALFACGPGSSVGGDDNRNCQPPGTPVLTEEPQAGGIRPFASETELDAYVAEIEANNAKEQAAASKCNGGSGGGADGGAAMSSAEPSSDKSANETITNNQEAGVDEGGIVKNIGGALVVLRQGRLYAVDVADGRAPTLTDSMRVARTESLNSNVWYDEMLVSGDLVYVVGYRYGAGSGDMSFRGATEIDSFRLQGGKLARLRSMFLESNDYYSGKNYASRMTGGKLVFYMPHYVGRDKGALAYPRVLEVGDDGAFRVKGPIFGALDVSTSLIKPRYATFHTVVQCALPESGDFDCHARSVLGSSWREHYVSNDAVYLWASSHVYRFDFASLDVRAHRAEGYPVDQFSFRQAEGELLVAANVLTDAQNPTSASSAALEKLPLAAFDKTGGQAAVPSIKFGPNAALTKNRFVGDTLVAALAPSSAGGGSGQYGYGGYGTNGPNGELVSVDAKTGAVSRAPSPSVVRLEPLGPGRVLAVSAHDQGLWFDARAVANLGTTLGNVQLAGVSEGEGRSHGFFYKAGEGGDGTFGYAVVNPPSYGANRGYGNGISNIGFFRVAPEGALASVGIVSAGDVATECETSCVDWYGNTRPIFLGQRTFALMGSELAEITMGSTVTKGAAAELRPAP